MISVIYLVYPEFLLTLFTDAQTTSPALLQQSQFVVRLVMMTFAVIGFQIVIGVYYQSIGLYKKAFILSLLRQLIVYIPLLLLFSWIWQLNGIRWSFATTDIVAAIMTVFIFRKDWKNLRKLANDSRAEMT